MEMGNVVPAPLFPYPPPISILEKMHAWKAKRFAPK